MLDDDTWGKGYASEIAEAALRFGFEELGLPAIVAAAAPENIASLRVLAKAGMRRDPDLITIEGVRAVRCVLQKQNWRAEREAV